MWAPMARRSSRRIKELEVNTSKDGLDVVNSGDEDQHFQNRKSTRGSRKVMVIDESSSEYSASESDNDEGSEGEEERSEAESSKGSPATRRPSSASKEGNIAVQSTVNGDKSDEDFSETKRQRSAASLKSLPKMDRKMMNQVLSETPDPFKSSTQALHAMYKDLNNYWLTQLKNGYNLLLYGFGSKKKLIDDFCTANLSKTYYLTINGFFPGLTLKQILNEITTDLLEHSGSFKSPSHQCRFICSELCNSKGETPDELFLIIHNIDGVSLRDEKVQVTLSLLAMCPKIQLVASVDHMNSPLLWDEVLATHFNWVWHDVTTFEHYSLETSYENSILVQQSGSLAMSSLTHVLKSLPEKAQKIFEVLAKYHLEHKKDPANMGIAFSDLYQRCREGFLANSDVTLRAQLTEFLDHKLIRSRKGADGTETLSVLVDENILEQFINQQL